MYSNISILFSEALKTTLISFSSFLSVSILPLITNSPSDLKATLLIFQLKRLSFFSLGSDSKGSHSNSSGSNTATFTNLNSLSLIFL